MPSVRTPPAVSPGSAQIQQFAAGLVFTSANAGFSALTGHFFSLVTPAAGALFGAAASAIGVGFAAYYALDKLQMCQNSKDLAERLAKTILSFFGGGVGAYFLTNAVGCSVSIPAAVILTGPVLATSLGFLALGVACFAATKIAEQGSHAVKRFGRQIENASRGPRFNASVRV